MAVVTQDSPPEGPPIALQAPSSPGNWWDHIEGRSPLHAAL